MKGSSLKKVAYTAFIVIFLGLIFLASVPENGTSPYPTEGKRIHYPIWIKGLTAKTIRDDKIINRIKTDELMINPRKFYIFSIKPFNELTLTNVRLEIHFYDDIIHENTNPFSLEEYIPSLQGVRNDLRGLGFITRGNIKGLVLEVFKNDRRSLFVQANEAHIDFKKKKIDLLVCSIIDNLTGKHVASDLITWDVEKKIFKIPGEYFAETPRGKATGKGIIIDLNFRVSRI